MTATLERSTGTHAPIPFTRLVTVEARKAVDTRSAKWLLALTVLVSIGVGVIPVCIPHDTEQTLGGYVDPASTGFALLLPILVILLVTTEWTQRTALTTFAFEPRRARVLSAKAVVAVALGLIAAALTFVIAAFWLALSATLGRDVAWTISGGHLVGVPLATVLSLLGALALASVLHNTAAAIVASFGLGIVVSVLAALIKGATRWFDVGQSSSW